MENRVNFIAYAENVPEDVNNLQAYVSASLDHIVVDTLVQGSKFSGFLTAKSGPAQVVVTAGRLYRNGVVYARTTPTTFDFTTQLPVAAKKKVLITAWGTEVDTGATPRNVLIAAQSTPQNPVYQPQILEITHSRIVNLGTSVGAEAPDPAAPVIDAALLLLATVVLSPTGVESVTVATENEVGNLEDLSDRVTDIETWEAVAAPMILSLASDIARISNDRKNDQSADLTGRILGRLAVLESRDGIPSNAADSLADFFLDPATSDLGHVASNCKVDEGVRFADDGVNETALQLFNPLNPQVTVANGVLFPTYEAALRISVGPQTGSVSLASYTYQTVEFLRKQMSRTRIRWGNPFFVCTNSAFWQSGRYDPVTHVFARNGETFQIAPEYQQAALVPHVFIRITQFWTDTYTEAYWDINKENFTVSGASVEETFPVGQDMWLHSIALRFTQLDSSGAVTMVVCECTSTGEIDPTRVIGKATVAHGSLSANGKTAFIFGTPVFLKAGSRYGFRIISGANHYIATANGPAFPNGMFFTMIGGYAIADPQKHIVFDLYACRFQQSLVAIDLQGLQLSGGIVGIDILAESVVPSSVSLTYAVQINGAWVPLDRINAGVLNAGGALPPLLPFRAVFQGTPDMMPCVGLLNSRVRVERPRTAFAHYWPAGGRTPPAATAQIRLTVRYENFDPLIHATSVRLLTGTGFVAETAASSYSDVAPEPGVIERTYVWNLGAAVPAFKFKATGSSSTPLNVFHIAWFKDWVL